MLTGACVRHCRVLYFKLLFIYFCSVWPFSKLNARRHSLWLCRRLIDGRFWWLSFLAATILFLRSSFCWKACFFSSHSSMHSFSVHVIFWGHWWGSRKLQDNHLQKTFGQGKHRLPSNNGSALPTQCKGRRSPSGTPDLSLDNNGNTICYDSLISLLLLKVGPFDERSGCRERHWVL